MGSNEKQLMLGISAALALAMGVIWVVPRLAGSPDAPVVETAAAPAQAVATAPEDPDVAEEPEALPAPEAEPEPEIMPEPDVFLAMQPAFDHFERQEDGEALIAGRAEPNQKIDIILAGEVVAQAVADGSGAFVAFISIPPSEQPRKLSMVADPDGEKILSAQEIIVAPFALPVAEPEEELIAEAEVAPAEEANVSEAEDVVEPVEAIAEAVSEPAVPAVEEPIEEVAAAIVDPIAPLDDAANEAPPEDAEAEVAEIADAEIAEAPEPDAAEPATTDNNVAVAEVLEEPSVDDVAVEAPDVETTEIEIVETEPSVAPVEEAKVDIAVAEPMETAEPEVTATTEPTATTAPTLLSDADGVRVLPPSDLPPEVLSNVAIDAITYDPSGEVLLSGRASGDGFVQVYVDNQPITTSRISVDGGWRTDLPQVDTGIYTLRIDEVDESGTVVSRVETPFKREEPEAVAAVLAEETSEEGFEVAVRTVQPGSTLWAIAREQFGEGIMYVEVFEANRDLIRDPNLIFPGQVFRMPEMDDTTGQ